MSHEILIALIATLPATLAAIATLIATLRNSRKVELVHKATNSMKDALVLAARIQGHQEGIEAEQARHLAEEK